MNINKNFSGLAQIDLSKFYSSNFINISSIAENLKQITELNKNIDFEKLLKSLPRTTKSSPITAIKNLKESYNLEKLCLVIGAGISSTYKIPSWNDLLQRLLMEDIEKESTNAILLSKLFSKIFNPSPLIAGRYLQDVFSDIKVQNKFEKEVRNAIYECLDENKESLIVEEIIKYCIAPGNSPNLDSIITYNYDDIIEHSLEKKNLEIPFESIYGQAIDPEDKKLKIYHVHGFLPRTGTLSIENKITLGELVYHEQYNNIYSWNNMVQINKFRDTTCLFMGTSLTDPNIRRLLDIANSQKKSKKFHYIFKKRIDKKWLKQTINNLIKEDPELIKDDADFKIDETIDFLIEMKNRFEEKDSESLGVKTVWIDDYEKEISQILNRIRN